MKKQTNKQTYILENISPINIRNKVQKQIKEIIERELEQFSTETSVLLYNGGIVLLVSRQASMSQKENIVGYFDNRNLYNKFICKTESQGTRPDYFMTRLHCYCFVEWIIGGE